MTMNFARLELLCPHERRTEVSTSSARKQNGL